MSNRIRTLVTRSFKSSDLAFDIPGILAWQNARLKVGEHVADADVVAAAKLSEALGERNNDDVNSIRYDAARISSEFGSKAIFALRNDAEIISLRQAILQRDMQYLRYYRSRDAIADTLIKSAAERATLTGSAVSKHNERHQVLSAEYGSQARAPWRGVKSHVRSETSSVGDSVSDLYITPIGMQTQKYTIVTTPSPPGGSTQTIDPVSSVPIFNKSATDATWSPLTRDAATGTKLPPGDANFANAEPKFYAQRTVFREENAKRITQTEGAELWHPQLSNDIDYLRLHGDLVAEDLKARISALSTEKSREVLAREFELIELEVRRSQVRLLATYAFIPYRGRVTAIYKDLGEYVNAGDPVARIEDESKVFLAGVIQNRGRVEPKQGATISAKNIFETNREVTIKASVASVRGHDADDDEWEVLLEADNPDGDQKLPLHYSFDPNSTTITITPS